MKFHVEKMLSYLTEKQLFEQTRDIIEETLSDKWPDNTPFTIFLTAGQFRNLNGFYGSKLILKELSSAYVGRLTRFYVMEHPSAMNHIFEVMERVNSPEDKAVERLQKYFTQKFGPVSEERIKELDEIATGWGVEAGNYLQDFIEKGVPISEATISKKDN